MDYGVSCMKVIYIIRDRNGQSQVGMGTDLSRYRKKGLTMLLFGKLPPRSMSDCPRGLNLFSARAWSIPNTQDFYWNAVWRPVTMLGYRISLWIIWIIGLDFPVWKRKWMVLFFLVSSPFSAASTIIKKEGPIILYSLTKTHRKRQKGATRIIPRWIMPFPQIDKG